MLLVLAVGGFATSCGQDDVDDAAYSEGYGVYFATDMDTEYLIEEGQTLVQIPVLRSKAMAADSFSVSVVATPSEEALEVLNIPYTADFAAGETKTTLDITFDFDDIEAGQEYAVTLQLHSEGNLSEYGLKVVDVVIKFDPWTLLEGEAHFRDAAVFELYTMGLGLPLAGNAQSACQVEQSDVDKNLYRLVEPFNQELVAQLLAPVGVGPADAAYFFSPANEYLYFVINEDNSAYILPSNTGISLEFNGEGIPYLFSYVPENFDEGDFPATKDEPNPYYGTYDPATKTITFPKGGVCVGCDLGWLFANTTGMTRIVLPGGLWMNPVVSAELKHIMLDSEMVRSATFLVTLNDDCSSYMAALAEGDISKDTEALAEVAAGMIDGSVESKTYTKAGEISIEYPRAGTYTLVLQPIGKDGKTYGAPVALVFEDLNAAVSPADFQVEVSVTELTQSTVTFETVPNTDKIYYYFDYMPKADFDAQLEAANGSMEVMISNYFADYIDYLNASSGYLYTIEEVIPLISTSGATTYSARRLDPNTEYTYFVFPIDIKTGATRGEVTVETIKTLSIEGASEGYKQWLGVWTVTGTEVFNIQTGAFGAAATFNIQLSAADADAGTYYMDGWDREFTGYGVPVYWNEAAGVLEFRNNQYMGYDSYNGAHRDFFGYFTYEMEVPAQDGSVQTMRGLELKYDYLNFEESTDNEVMMVGEIAADGTATVTGQMIKGEILNANDEIEVIDAKVAGMNVFALDDKGGFYGVFATFNLSLGDYTLTKVPETAPQNFGKAATMPVRMNDELQKQLNNTPKMVRLNEAARNNYVMAR